VSGDGVIVVAGEALIDLVLAPDGRLGAHPGDLPFNTARALSRLEQDVLYLGRISDDRFGAQLRGELAGDGVRLDAVVDTSDPTTLALAEIDAEGVASYRFYTDGTSAPGLTPEAALAAVPDDVAMVHVGTLGLVLEPMATALRAVVAGMPASTLVMLDPNCRPALIPDRWAYRREREAPLARTDVVKVSEEDLAWLEPGAEAAAAARSLLADGADVALVTRGGDGALLVTEREERPVAAPRANVVDTIGAGDSFSAGFLAWWRLRGLGREDLENLEEVVHATEFACAVAARTVERAGATPPGLSELEL
jgi:fructokinase